MNIDGKAAQSFTIALLIIGSFVIFFEYTLLSSTTPITLETLKEVTALYGGYVAAVLVYYFGQRQTQSLEKRVEDITRQVEDYRRNYDTAARDTTEVASGGEEEIDNVLEEIEMIKRRLGIR